MPNDIASHCFQNEREQIMTTNVWLTQVNVMKSHITLCQSMTFPLILN